MQANGQAYTTQDLISFASIVVVAVNWRPFPAPFPRDLVLSWFPVAHQLVEGLRSP